MSARLPILTAVPAWHADGLCQQVDPELFFPDTGQHADAAKAICRQCPVAEKCLRWSLEKREKHGVWGGLSEKERRAVLNRKQVAAA